MMKNMARDESGQSILEYMLLLGIIAIMGGLIMSVFRGTGFGQKLQDRLLKPYAAAYRYGHPQAKGNEDGAPANQIKFGPDGANNFRIFINPKEANQ